jgi:ATP-binding cassette subfamily C protein
MRQLRLYLGYLSGVGRLRLAGAVGLIVICSLSEGLGLAVLIAVLQVVGLDIGTRGAMNDVAAAITAAFAAVGMRPTLTALLFVYVFVMGAHSLLGRAQSVAIFIVEQRFVLALRTRLYRAIANADWLYLCRSRATDFTQALTQEAGRLGEATFVMLTLTADIIVSIVLVGFAFTVSPTTTILVLVGGFLLLIVYSRAVRKLHDDGTELSASTKVLYEAAIEHTQSLKTAKAHSAQERMIALFTDAASRVSDAYRIIARRKAAVGSSFEIGSTIALAAMLFVAAEMLHLPSAAILTLLLIFSRLMPRFLSAHGHMRNFVSDLPAFATIIDLIERCEGAAEPPRTSDPAPIFKRVLRLENVSFNYGRDPDPTVEAIDLVIERGTITALAGPSGSGKSTVADLAMGLLAPAAGQIFADDMPLTRANILAWREQVGYVGPDTPLFHSSLRANLLWARPDATEAEMMNVLRSAAAEDLVLSLPGQLDALVGDRGVLLSQGERQRVGLARALLRRPRLLILDEATSGLDSETETLVMRAIQRLQDNTTVLLIAHRLSTLRWADKIYVMENGRIAESGSFAALEGSAGQRFRALVEAQQILLSPAHTRRDLTLCM